MNPDAPRTPREELEIKITALLMGQLSPEEAAEVEAQIAADPELAALHARLRHAAHLLRESRTLPEPSALAEPLQLSKERREKLLATFRGIKPVPSPVPRPVPVPNVVQKHRKDRKWVAPIALAASIAVLIGGGVVFLGGGHMKDTREMAAYGPVTTSDPRSEKEWYRAVKLNQSSRGEQPQDYSIERTLSLTPSSSSTSSRPISGGQDSLAANSESRWKSQPGVVRNSSGEKTATELKLYASIDESTAPANSLGKPVIGSGQGVPGVAGLPGTMSGRMGGGGGRASGRGVYLPSGDSNGVDTAQPSTKGLAGAKPADPRAPGEVAMRIESFTINGSASASAPAAATVTNETDQKEALGSKMLVDGSGLVTKQSESAEPAGETLGFGESLSKLSAANQKGDANKPAQSVAGGRPLAANPITAGNRSGSLATNSNAIDALLFDTAGVGEINKSSGMARGDGLQDALNKPADADAIKQPSQDAEDNVQLGRYYKAPQDASRSTAVREVQSQWERPYPRFDRNATEVRSKSKPGETPAGSERALAELKDQPTQGRDRHFAGGSPQKENADGFGDVNTQSEGTYWEFQNGVQTARSKSDRMSVVRDVEKEDTKAKKAAEEPAAVNLGGFAASPAITSGGTAGASGMAQDGDFDRSISQHINGRFGFNVPDGTRQIAPITPPPVLTGTAQLAGEDLAYFAAPQIPQTFGNAASGAGIAVPATPATAAMPETTLDLSTLPVLEPLVISTPLKTAGKVQLDGGVFTPFAPPAKPGEQSPNAKSPAGPAVASKPAAAPAPAQGVAPAQEKFVGAFLAVRKAEEKAAAGDAQNAQKLYREAADEFATIKQQWPEWQPELLEYRLKRTEEALSQVESKLEKKEPAAEEQLSKERKAKETSEPDTPVKAPEPAPVPQPEISTKENAFSTFSLNVSDVSFQLAGASLEKGTMPEPATVRSEEFINALNYRDPEPVAGASFAFASERARYPFAHNRDLLRLSVKTAAAGREAGKPLNLVLLLDNSGSMERADRVRILKESLRVLTQQLQPQDKLSLITFSRTPRLWADGVSGEKAAEVTQRVGEITPQGGTDLSAAMDLGYQTALKHYQAGSVNRVVLLTDGAANLGDVKAEALKAKVEAHRKQGVAFDCFGVGWEGYNDDLLEQLSRNGDGRYGFINTPEAAATEFAGQLAGALRVAASDVKVQVEFNPRRVLAYRQVGYAKHQLKKEQFRDNTVDAAEIGAAESGNALYVIEVNPRGEGDIATVRVRFKVPGTSEYQEHDWTVPFQAPAPAMEQSSSSLRLAATAAAFSEWLVQSPFATEVTSDRLLGMINGIPAIYGADRRPAKLESIIRQAKSISGR